MSELSAASPPPVLPPVAPARSLTPPPAPKSGGGWKVFAVIVTVLLLGSLLANLILGAGSMANLASVGTSHKKLSQLHEIVIEDNDAPDKILVLDISGVITDQAIGYDGTTMIDALEEQLVRAAEDERVRAIVLRMDSPGGEVLASDEIYRLLRDFQEEHEIPVVTSMGSLAASGGYYISAASRWIVANELTITGSIGVIFHGYNYRGLMDKVGVQPDVVKSGKLKDMFSGDRRPEDVLPEEKQILSGMVAESFTRFKTVIREGRGWAAEQNAAESVEGFQKLAPNWEEFADGRIMSGTTAHQLGLVDELGNFDTAVRRALSLAGIESANLVAYFTPPSFANLLRFFGKSEARTVRVDVAGLDLVPRLPQGRLYFLSPLHLH